MLAFWDTSALLALIFEEVHSPEAQAANDATDSYFSWRWISVEGRLGWVRRGGDDLQQVFLDRWFANAEYLDVAPGDCAEVIAFGSRHRLRAADAGHLFCLLQVNRIFPDVVFVCFDGDLAAAAKKEGVKVWGE